MQDPPTASTSPITEAPSQPPSTPESPPTSAPPVVAASSQSPVAADPAPSNLAQPIPPATGQPATMPDPTWTQISPSSAAPPAPTPTGTQFTPPAVGDQPKAPQFGTNDVTAEDDPLSHLSPDITSDTGPIGPQIAEGSEDLPAIADEPIAFGSMGPAAQDTAATVVFQFAGKFDSRETPLSGPTDAAALPSSVSFLPPVPQTVQAPQAKAPISTTTQTRDQSVSQIPQTLGPTAGQSLQFANSPSVAVGKDDILTRVRDVQAVSLPNSERALGALTRVEAPSSESVAASISVSSPQPLSQAVVEYAGAPYGMLAVNMLNLDSTTLCSSIQDFFDKIDLLGVTLTDNQCDLLYSAGIILAAAGLALETVRRQTKSQPPALASGRGAIPYSTSGVP